MARTSGIVQALARASWAARRTGSTLNGRIHLAPRVRKQLVRWLDPAIRFGYQGTTLHLPLSHALPDITRDHPLYGTAIGRVGLYMKEKYPDLTAIDVGANVGDSVAVMRRQAHFPILCVEGSPTFLDFLSRNTSGLDDIVLHAAYLADRRGAVNATVVEGSGTGRLVGGGRPIQLETLDDVVGCHDRFAAAKLVKIDTDGHDPAVIRGGTGFLSRSRPVLFFEWDPRFSRSWEDWKQVSATLQAAGYVRLMFYLNTGEYLMSSTTHNEDQLDDLSRFCLTHPEAYFDCCAFHHEDEDLAATVRGSEIAFFISLRTDDLS